MWCAVVNHIYMCHIMQKELEIPMLTLVLQSISYTTV